MVAFDAEKSEERVKNGKDSTSEKAPLPHPLLKNTGTSSSLSQHQTAQVYVSLGVLNVCIFIDLTEINFANRFMLIIAFGLKPGQPTKSPNL